MRPSIVRKWVLPRLMRRTWPDVLARRSELERSQWLGRSELDALVLERVRELLATAALRSPFHRARLADAGCADGGLAGLDELGGLPILEKRDLKEHLEDILVEDAGREGLTLSATGGTTGEPTRYYWDDAYWCASSAVSLRGYGFAGFEPGDRHCMIWGTAFHTSRRAALRERLINTLKNVLVVPGFELSEESMARWAARVVRQRPALVEGYTSLLMLFGSHLLKAGETRIRPGAVISSAEKLHGFQRELISEAFGAPVLDRYGSREVGCIAHECREGHGLHVNVEHVLVEIVRGDRVMPAGESGEILVTSLSNRVFPFIRYRIGDLGRLLPDPCPCGRSLPLLEITDGRVHDLIATDKGTWLPGEFFPHLFKEFPGVETFQVHQAADRVVTVRIVRNDRWDRQQEARYREEIAKVLGEDARLGYEYVSEIPRTAAGKLRFTVSEVPADLAHGLTQVTPDESPPGGASA